ncbi:Sugar transport protein 5 [Spatholobus suberectus]|nr:Sugar transport protein 5 [Spatholobus suberectus]
MCLRSRRLTVDYLWLDLKKRTSGKFEIINLDYEFEADFRSFEELPNNYVAVSVLRSRKQRKRRATKMAVGGFAVDAPANGFGGKITLSVVITCIVAASSGLIFGYDIGITGGVTTMKPFLRKFFPAILRKSARAETNVYCVYDNQLLTLFTSSLHLAGLVSSLLASRVTTALGRRNTMIFGGCIFFAGGAINGAAENIAMLILGRILLGLGVGFTNQATPVYLSEIAPPKWRGAFNTGFQFFIGVGVVAANCINYGTARLTWGWRVSLGLATVPAIMMTIGAFLIPDTPSSLVERGQIDKARNALRKVRGPTVDVEPELEQVVKLSQVSKAMEQESFLTIFEKQYRPQLVMAFAIPLSQQLTGINIVAFYAPNLFQSVGFGNDSALLSAVILGLVNLASILVSTAVVDRFGRRFLFIVGGIQMLVCMLPFQANTEGFYQFPREMVKGFSQSVRCECLLKTPFVWHCERRKIVVGALNAFHQLVTLIR